MRWKIVVAGLVLAFAGTTGCKQQCFLMECDYQHYHQLAIPHLDTNPTASILPATSEVPTPTTILSPEREIRYLSLKEAIAMALEQGTVGSESVLNPGFGIDNLATFTGRGVTRSDAIRVFALDPAISGAEIETSLAKFDTRWTTSMTWNTTDRPVGTSLDVFQAQRLNAIETQDASFNTSLVKPLPTGGVAGITFRTDYQFTNLPARVNPSYRPTLLFGVEQPLLQGYGVEINQLRAAHPGVLGLGGTLPQFRTSTTQEGILVTRLRFDQQRAEFERVVHVMVVNVEVAYWNLYGSYWNLYSREQALRQAYEAWKINRARFQAGRINLQDFAQTRRQYELFRSQRITALGQILENERQLRKLIGLPVEDGHRLVPVDAPTLTPYQPDWHTAVNEALALRPELILVRQELKRQQLSVIEQKNALLPDLRFFATYDINAVGSRLDGPDADNALRNLASNRFNNWQLGLRLEVPLGFREAHSNLRIARLNLARAYSVLYDQEQKAQSILARQYRLLFESYGLIEALRAQREAAADELGARFQEFVAGRGTLDILLEAQRVWADSLRDEYNAIVQYNNSLAQFEFAKGTILQYDNVVIGEGPLPECAKVRAVEHERQRHKALVLRTRPHPAVTTPCCFEKGQLGFPQLPDDGTALTAPALVEGQPPLPEIKERGPDKKLLDQMPPRAETPARSAPGGEPAGKVTTGVVLIEDPSAPPPATPGLPRLPAPPQLPPKLSGKDTGSGTLPPASGGDRPPGPR
jgi:outer membrane protein TolC